LALSYVSIAQEPYTIKYNKSNGLPSNAVFNVFQDSKGFMWFATNAGLTRYDGFEYKTYTSPAQTSTPGSSILEDNYGRIWYENFDGYLYFVQNDSLHALQQNDPIQYLSITLTKKHVFVLQKKGLDVYDLKTLKRQSTEPIILDNVEFSNNSETNFYCIEKDVIFKLDETLKLSTAPFLKNIDVKIKQLYCHNHKIYIVSKFNTTKLVYVFDENLKHLYNIPIKEPEFIQGVNFSDDLIWINTPQGSHAYHDDKTKTGLYKTLFKEKSISYVKKDRQHNYWYSSTNEGVFMAPNLNNIVYSQQNLLPNKISATKKGFLIATKKGEICMYDSLLNFKSILNKQTDNSEIYYLSYDSISNDLFYSSKGFTQAPQLNFQNCKHLQSAIKEITRIDAAYYAIAASGYCGLATFNDEKKTTSVWNNYHSNHLKVEAPNTSSIIEGVRGKSVAYNQQKNTIYFATNIGLFKCTPSSTKEIKFNAASFYASRIIFYNNTIYALSTKGDLYSITNETNFIQLNAKNNIKNFDIKFIKQYNKKLIVIASGYAYLYDLDTEQLSKIDVNINAYEVNDVLLKNNTLLLLTNSGIIKADINNSTIKKEKAILQITNLSANGKSFNLNESTNLAYNQNDIAIRFSVLDFGTSKENNVFYKVNEDDWKRVSNETRLIEFASLKPGKYAISFKINEQITVSVIQFTIITPFWQSIWFLIMCFLFTLALGFTYYRWQLNKLRTKNKLLEDKNRLLNEKIELEHNLNKSVLKSIKAQMNPHFFYNALNTIQAYIFTNDKTKANSYLAKFSKLTRVILEQSEKETISLGDEIESLTLYLELEKMRFKEAFEYTIEQKTDTHKDSIEFPPMLIQPYVENAIKHGLLHKESDRTLLILFEEIKNHLVITIDDNGIGRKRSEELNKIKNDKYQSFSTQANEKRLEILNHTNDKIAVKIIDKNGANGQSLGTKVILTIPII
jgi:sensor histidine kinase YesM